MQMALMISKQTRKATVAYVEYKYSRAVGLEYLSCYVALILGLLGYYTIHNYDNACIYKEYRWW